MSQPTVHFINRKDLAKNPDGIPADHLSVLKITQNGRCTYFLRGGCGKIFEDTETTSIKSLTTCAIEKNPTKEMIYLVV